MKNLNITVPVIIALFILPYFVNAQGNSVEVKVVFPYFEVNETNVTLNSWSPSASYTMEKQGANT